MKGPFWFAIKALSVCLGAVALLLGGAFLLTRPPGWPSGGSGIGKPRPEIFSAHGHQSEDCEIIARVLAAAGEPRSADECRACQGAPCEGPRKGCDNLPCRDGNLVVRGCDGDTDCQGLSRYCGTYASKHYMCVISDPH